MFMFQLVNWWTDRQTGRQRINSEDRRHLRQSNESILSGEDDFIHVETEIPDTEYMLSKTVELGRSKNLEEVEPPVQTDMKGWTRWDQKYFIPFFRKRFTQQEIRQACDEMQDLTTKWHTDVEGGSQLLDEDEHSL